MSRFRVGSCTSAEVALHLHEAGSAADPHEAAEWSLRAAREASAVYAWDEAIQHADAALDLLEGRCNGRAAGRGSGLRRQPAPEVEPRVRPKQSRCSREPSAATWLPAWTPPPASVHSRIGGALSLHHSVMDIPRALEHFDAAERLLGGDPKGAFHVSRGRSQAAMFGLRTDVLGIAADAAARDRLRGRVGGT